MSAKSGKAKFHYGWIISFVGFVTYFFVMCVVINCAGLFVKPVSESLGISRSQFSLTTSCVSLAGMILSMKLGRIYHRFTIRRTMTVSAIILPFAYGSYSIAPNIYIFYALAMVVGFCMCALCSIAVSTLVANWFHEKRGLAVALASTGSGVGGIILNPLITYLIGTVGWRQTYLILAVMMAVTVIPCSWFLVRDYPSDMGLEPYGEAGAAHVIQPPRESMTLPEARRSAMFWMWILVHMTAVIGGTSIAGHLVPYITDIGHSDVFAAGIASLQTASLAVGKIIVGRLVDKWGSKWAGVLSLSSYVVALTMFQFAEHVVCLYIAGVALGFGISFATIVGAVAVQDLFGSKHYADIYGNICVFTALGGVVGSPTVAAVFDAVGTYKPAWLGLESMMMISIVLMFMIFSQKKKRDCNGIEI